MNVLFPLRPTIYVYDLPQVSHQRLASPEVPDDKIAPRASDRRGGAHKHGAKPQSRQPRTTTSRGSLPRSGRGVGVTRLTVAILLVVFLQHGDELSLPRPLCDE